MGRFELRQLAGADPAFDGLGARIYNGDSWRRPAAFAGADKRVWREHNMKKADLKVFRDQLLDIRARLRGDVTSMASAALRKSGAEGSESSMPIHMAELGSDNFEQEFT